MSRYGMFGSGAPGRNHLSTHTAADSALYATPCGEMFGLGAAPRETFEPHTLSALVMNPPKPKPQPPSRNALLLASLIAGTSPPPPKPVFRSIWVDGVEYRFRVMSVRARPWQKNCVYAFMRDGWPAYVGKAYSAYTRFGTEHDRRAEAIALGANELWVTEVRTTSAFDLDEAEQRMIAKFCPVLNDKHNPLSLYR